MKESLVKGIGFIRMTETSQISWKTIWHIDTIQTDTIRKVLKNLSHTNVSDL